MEMRNIDKTKEQLTSTTWAKKKLPICIGVILMPAVGIADLVFCIIASVKANSGEAYRYPVSIRFIK